MILLKSLLRVAPAFAMIQVPVHVPMGLRLLFSLPLALILSQRLTQDGVPAELAAEDLVLGLGVGAFLSLFFAAAMKVSFFFGAVQSEVEEEENPWRKVIESFFFIFLILIFMALRLERNFLELLALQGLNLTKFNSVDIWAAALNDLTWLGVKMSSFGLLLMLTKTLFEEIYRRLGGESLRLVFSCCVWLALLAMTPLIFPSFSDFVSAELADFWKKWLGVAL